MCILRLLFSIIICIFIVTGTAQVQADSLYDRNQPSLFSTARPPKIGDVITVYVSEASSAAQQAGTNTSKSSSIQGTFTDIWNQVANPGSSESSRKDKQIQIGGGDKYTGAGKTTRTSQVKAIVSVLVTEILENGNLYIVGDHQVKVNDEAETIHITGIIRPIDIGPNNSIYSYQIAKAEVSVKGTGVVASKQTPGILTKMFDWLF